MHTAKTTVKVSVDIRDAVGARARTLGSGMIGPVWEAAALLALGLEKSTLLDAAFYARYKRGAVSMEEASARVFELVREQIAAKRVQDAADRERTTSRRGPGRQGRRSSSA